VRINPRFINRFVKLFLGGQAYFTVGILVVIILIIFFKGFSHLSIDFILSYPEDMGRHGGIFPAIVGTFFLVLLSVVLAAPLGLGAAIFLAEYTQESRLTKVIRFGVESLAGIPSIIYGLFGFIFFVNKLHMGWSLLAGALTVTIMILPTIIRTSEEALKAVPKNLRMVSYSLGATRWETTTKVVLPVAAPGILTGIMLSIARIVEETAVVIFTMGSSLRLPTSLMDSGRTMAVHFYLLAREGISMEMAYATALVLILNVLAVNISAYYIMSRVMKRYS
jgi:phosphate transport system permease protein